MSTVFLGLGAAVAAAALLVGLGWLFHRICTRLEEAGYLYYRKSGGGGSAGGVLYELDKLTRPSVEHVIDVQDTIKEEAEIDGD